MKYNILKNIPDLHKKEKNVFITNALSQKNALQRKTGVALPDSANVTESREFVEENKK